MSHISAANGSKRFTYSSKMVMRLVLVSLQPELREYVAALSRPYSKRTKAQLVESLLEAVQQHKDSHQGQAAGPQGTKKPAKRRVSEVATGDLEVGTDAAYHAHCSNLPACSHCAKVYLPWCCSCLICRGTLPFHSLPWAT